MASLQEYYKNDCVPKLMDQFGYKSIMEVPRITKVVLNMGLGEAVQNPKMIDGRLMNLPELPVRRRLSPRPKGLLPGLSYVRVCQLVAELHCVGKRCMIFWQN